MRIHFIAGLPRSGSTLLEGILRQNPRFHAAISGPLALMATSLIRSMSGFNDVSAGMTDDQRERVLRSMIEAYYAHLEPGRVVFDTNRAWCALLPAVAKLFPEAKVVCCVRNPAWILDSIECHVQRNPFGASRMFNYEASGNVYTRVETLMGKDGFVRKSLSGLRQAWFGSFAERLIAIRYESLVSHPGDTMGRLYQALGEPAYVHDFGQVDYDEPGLDSIIGFPGFHRVSGPVAERPRDPILPPDLFRQYSGCFWDKPDENPRGVTVV